MNQTHVLSIFHFLKSTFLKSVYTVVTFFHFKKFFIFSALLCPFPVITSNAFQSQIKTEVVTLLLITKFQYSRYFNHLFKNVKIDSFSLKDITLLMAEMYNLTCRTVAFIFRLAYYPINSVWIQKKSLILTCCIHI